MRFLSRARRRAYIKRDTGIVAYLLKPVSIRITEEDDREISRLKVMADSYKLSLGDS